MFSVEKKMLLLIYILIYAYAYEILRYQMIRRVFLDLDKGKFLNPCNFVRFMVLSAITLMKIYCPLGHIQCYIDDYVSG